MQQIGPHRRDSAAARLSPAGGALTFTLLVLACLTGCAVDVKPWMAGPLPVCVDEGGGGRPTPVQRHGSLAVTGTKLVDAQGVPVQLKGPSSMWLNYDASGYGRSCAGLQFMRNSWNATLVRAAMGVEPGGAYLSNPDRATFDARTVVENAVALGMYVIIDWHAHEATNHQAEAVAFFQEMARLYGHLPNVIYEPFNEPVRISWVSDLKPYHRAVIDAIRAIDPDNVIILGTPNWSQYVDEAATSPLVGTNLMYTLHFYSCTHDQWLRDKADVALGAGLALFVTEWGATDADGGTTANPGLCLDEAQVWHTWMNTNQVSWAAWKLDACVDSSCFFRAGTPTGGNWTERHLKEHGVYVRDRMLD